MGVAGMRAPWQVAVRPTVTMTRLDLVSPLTTLGPYAVVAAAAGLAAVLLQNDLHRVAEDGLLILSEPFAIPLYGGALLLTVILAVSAALAVAREREHGAIELLHYGPVSPLSYLLAKGCGHVLQYGAQLLLLLGCFILLSLATGLRLSGPIVLAMTLTIGPAAAAAMFGLLVASLLRRLRPAMLVALGLSIVAVGLQMAREVLIRLPAPEFHVNPVLLLRWAVFAISSVTQWVLPFGYLDRELSAMLRGDAAAALAAAVGGSIYAAVALLMAAAALEWTGLRR